MSKRPPKKIERIIIVFEISAILGLISFAVHLSTPQISFGTESGDWYVPATQTGNLMANMIPLSVFIAIGIIQGVISLLCVLECHLLYKRIKISFLSGILFSVLIVLFVPLGIILGLFGIYFLLEGKSALYTKKTV